MSIRLYTTLPLVFPSLVATTIYGHDIVESTGSSDVEGSIEQGENEKGLDEKHVPATSIV
jgi:hypothetical protein